MISDSVQQAHNVSAASQPTPSDPFTLCFDFSIPDPSLHSTQPSVNEQRLYLAIDCGGTKAAAAISDQTGIIIGRGIGGPANYTDVGLDRFLQSVKQAIRQALLQSNLGAQLSTHPLLAGSNTVQDTVGNSKSRSGLGFIYGHGDVDDNGSHSSKTALFEAAWFGIAGVDSEQDIERLSPYLGNLLSLSHWSPRLLVANDTSLLAAPVCDPAYPTIRSGVAVIAGTGSIVMSFKEGQDGTLNTLTRVGGFGWLLGDEGSGFCVGRDALRFLLDQADHERTEMIESLVTCPTQGQPHLLRDRILVAWNLSSTDEILKAFYCDQPLPQPQMIQPTSTLTAPSSIGSPESSSSPPDSVGCSSVSLLEIVDESADNSTAATSQNGNSTEELVDLTKSLSLTSSQELLFIPPVAPTQSIPDRKNRLASLAPIVFDLAFKHQDIHSLDILRGQANKLAKQIARVFPKHESCKAFISADSSVLCMGGSLLGVAAYQKMLEEELQKLGIVFCRSTFVNDPAKSGAEALARMWEDRIRS